MKSLPFFAFALLLVLQPAHAGEPGDDEERAPAAAEALEDAADAPCVEPVEAPSPIGKATPLHKAGAKLLKRLVCEGNQACLRKAGPRLERAAHTVVDICLAEPQVPKWMCLGFVGSLGNESGGKEHPTCGHVNQDCAKDCDRLTAGRPRQACYLNCARDQGIRPGGARWKRIKKCNDRGTSRGPFQQKPSSIRYCKRILKDPNYNPHDLAQSARCVIKKVKRSAYKKSWPCKRRSVTDRWKIAMKRVGRGPMVTIEEAVPPQCYPTTTPGKQKCEPAKPAIRQQRCENSRYAEWGWRHYRSCGKPCYKMHRPTVEELKQRTVNPKAPVPGRDVKIIGQGK